MFQWIGFFFAMIELAIIAYYSNKKEEVPMIPVCICSALAIFFIVMHLSC